jgi:hypothetical protein
MKTKREKRFTEIEQQFSDINLSVLYGWRNIPEKIGLAIILAFNCKRR